MVVLSVFSVLLSLTVVIHSVDFTFRETRSLYLSSVLIHTLFLRLQASDARTFGLTKSYIGEEKISEEERKREIQVPALYNIYLQ